MENLITNINRIDTKAYLFVIVVMLLCFTAFTHNTGMIDLAKMMLASFGTFILGQASVKA